MRGMILAVLLLLGGIAQAQTFNEWFRQKSTQRKYLLQQIAALEVYKGYVKKGYQIVSGGLDVIQDMRNGEFGLHKNYFSSLKKVNPKIRRSIQVFRCIELEAKLIRQCNRHMGHLRRSGRMSKEQLDYLEGVFRRVLDDCASTLDELLALITDGQLEMKDDERIKRINELHGAIESQYLFVERFGGDALRLAAARETEQQEVDRVRGYYGNME